MIPTEKQMLRRKALEALRGMTPAERAAKSLAIGAHLQRVAAPILAFAPMRLEPDWLTGWTGAEFALPRVERERLEFYRVHAGTAWQLEVGALGAREPKAISTNHVALADAETIFVPGLAFDRAGRRLGRGAGYYDRLLAHPALRARRIGVAFAAQLVDEVPVEPHDQSLDALVTENGWIDLREARSSGSGRG